MLEPTGGSGGALGGVFTPPTGSAGSLRAAADQLRSHASNVGDMAASARSNSQGLVASGEWAGPAADGYGRFSSKVESLASGTEEPLSSIGGGIEDYAAALETAQNHIGDAANRYRTAMSAAQNLQNSVNSNPNRTQADVTAAQQKVNEYQRQMDAAKNDAEASWRRYNQAADAAAQRLTGVASDLNSGTTSSGVAPVLESAGGESGEGGMPKTIAEDTHKVLEWSEHGIEGLEKLGDDLSAADAAKAIDNPEFFSSIWNSVKSDMWAGASDWAETWGPRVGGAGTVLSGVLGGFEQFEKDKDNPNLNTGDKIDRIATKGALDAAGGYAGAAVGSDVGGAVGGVVGGALGSVIPFAGTAGGAAVGDFVGTIAGGALGGWIGSGGASHMADWLNNNFNGGVHAVGDAVSSVSHTVGHVLSDLNPF